MKVDLQYLQALSMICIVVEQSSHNTFVMNYMHLCSMTAKISQDL